MSSYHIMTIKQEKHGTKKTKRHWIKSHDKFYKPGVSLHLELYYEEEDPTRQSDLKCEMNEQKCNVQCRIENIP